MGDMTDGEKLPYVSDDEREKATFDVLFQISEVEIKNLVFLLRVAKNAGPLAFNKPLREEAEKLLKQFENSLKKSN